MKKVSTTATKAEQENLVAEANDRIGFRRPFQLLLRSG
jgi:hypothetical protein